MKYRTQRVTYGQVPLQQTPPRVLWEMGKRKGKVREKKKGNIKGWGRKGRERKDGRERKEKVRKDREDNWKREKKREYKGM